MISRDQLYRSQNKYQVKYQSKIHNPQNPKTSPSLHPNPTLSLSPDQRQAGRREREENEQGPYFVGSRQPPTKNRYPKKRIKFQKEQEMTQSTRGKKKAKENPSRGGISRMCIMPDKGKRERSQKSRKLLAGKWSLARFGCSLGRWSQVSMS
jgi:hypothetical protein